SEPCSTHTGDFFMNSRRDFLRRSSAFPLAAAIPSFVLSSTASAADSPPQRVFEPRPQDGWLTFEVTTRVDIDPARGATQVWLPLPSIESGWQRTLGSGFSSNGATRMVKDGKYGARMLHARFTPAQEQPFVELKTRVRTRDRALDWSQPRSAKAEDAKTLAFWTQPTELIPTDGIVRSTALEVTRAARGDVAKTRAIYEWVVHNTYREPAVRGCGEGDIKAMLEGGNLGGKCADINALFVGMCRAVGIPARDLYGVRLAPSKFGYRELVGNPDKLSGAQHCRAEA